jgi:hypothetical protein
LSATALKLLRKDIFQERRKREPEAIAKAKEWGDRRKVLKEEAPANGISEPPSASAKPRDGIL